MDFSIRLPADTGLVQQLQDSGVAEVTTLENNVALVVIRDFDALPEDVQSQLRDLGLTPPGDDVDNQGAYNAITDLSSQVKFDIYAVMSLMHEISKTSRQQAREGRAASRDMQMTALQTAADKIRSAAGWALAAGITTGAATALAGIATMAGSVAGGLKAKGASGDTMMKDLEIAKSWSQGIGSLGEITKGGGQIISAGLSFESEQQKAEQKEFESFATMADSFAQSESEMMNDMKETLRMIQEKLAAILQSDIDTARKIMA